MSTIPANPKPNRNPNPNPNLELNLYPNISTVARICTMDFRNRPSKQWTGTPKTRAATNYKFFLSINLKK